MYLFNIEQFLVDNKHIVSFRPQFCVERLHFFRHAFFTLEWGCLTNSEFLLAGRLGPGAGALGVQKLVLQFYFACGARNDILNSAESGQDRVKNQRKTWGATDTGTSRRTFPHGHGCISSSRAVSIICARITEQLYAMKIWFACGIPSASNTWEFYPMEVFGMSWNFRRRITGGDERD